VVWNRRFGTIYPSHLQRSSCPKRRTSCTSRPLKMEPTSSPEMSVSNHLTPRNNPRRRKNSWPRLLRNTDEYFFSLPVTVQSTHKGNKYTRWIRDKGERNQGLERSIPVNILYRENNILEWVHWTNNRALWQGNQVWGWSRWTWLWVQMV
jgi:hypothetical protein